MQVNNIHLNQVQQQMGEPKSEKMELEKRNQSHPTIQSKTSTTSQKSKERTLML